MEDNNKVYVKIENDEPDTSTAWFFFMRIVDYIPLVGLIVHIVYAFSSENTSRKSYCKALIIWDVVSVLLVLLVYWLWTFSLMI